MKSGGALREDLKEKLSTYATLCRNLILYLQTQSSFMSRRIDTDSTEVEESQEIMRSILAQDELLLLSARKLKQHQELQQKISLLELELAQKNAVILKLALQLKEVENALQEIVDTTKNKLKHKPGDLEGVTVGELVAYAHKISSTTSAPFQPPAPQGMDMLMSHINNLSPEGKQMLAPLPEATTNGPAESQSLLGGSPLVREEIDHAAVAIPMLGPTPTTTVLPPSLEPAVTWNLTEPDEHEDDFYDTLDSGS
jgi:hypothetical protein